MWPEQHPSVSGNLENVVVVATEWWERFSDRERSR